MTRSLRAQLGSLMPDDLKGRRPLLDNPKGGRAAMESHDHGGGFHKEAAVTTKRIARRNRSSTTMGESELQLDLQPTTSYSHSSHPEGYGIRWSRQGSWTHTACVWFVGEPQARLTGTRTDEVDDYTMPGLKLRNGVDEGVAVAVMCDSCH
ncbi:hypothetical protein MBM_02994 [Drepanopeziza brunnea f. sp. 'multigermtubi' MB_m1]|uniref:Uncharacterized protein n=1 Tax=Marssonina brunnea f. sp. multigermtubi (strain MB_m1) TaxID=1072389 RepID=K1X168_MARBU|nr:uncharacterized protein MBM_02994 [Drepanopeziza brunnea f. sp. 'multigermtubi' MB_m1]EKD18752.1 hypothetical protein MBM_02994 [Drepanopeziza brunnea f. sp. 'multigermtubi' MB_m1]